jgi:hypothetical protein
MSTLPELAREWMAAKDAERDAVETRRLIEDQIAKIMEINDAEEGTRNIATPGYSIKVSTRINRKVDGDIAQELASEHNISDMLPLLFRWKPELSMTAWHGVTDEVRRLFSAAITSTPGRPSFSISKKDV